MGVSTGFPEELEAEEPPGGGAGGLLPPPPPPPATHLPPLAGSPAPVPLGSLEVVAPLPQTVCPSAGSTARQPLGNAPGRTRK